MALLTSQLFAFPNTIDPGFAVGFHILILATNSEQAYPYKPNIPKLDGTYKSYELSDADPVSSRSSFWTLRVYTALRLQLDGFDGFIRNHKYLIYHRDHLYSQDMIDMPSAYGVCSVKLPPLSPNLNAYAERFVRSIKSERLDRIIPIGERHLRNAIDAYIEHYNRDRPHQGLGNELLTPSTSPTNMNGKIVCDQQLGGLIRSYRRAA